MSYTASPDLIMDGLSNMTNMTNMTGGPGASSSLYTATVRRALVIATVVPAIVEAILCSIVLYAAFRVKAYRSAVNFLVVNATAADLLRGIHGLFAPALFYDTLGYTDVHQGLCVCYFWVHILQYCWSMWSIALIAYSRYDMVAHPFHRVLNIKRAVVAVCVVLIESILFASLPLMGWNGYGLVPLRPGIPKYRCAVADKTLSAGHKAFLPVFYAVNYLLPLIAIVICYGLIIPIALRHRRRQSTIHSPSLSFSVESSGKEVQLTEAKSSHTSPRAIFSSVKRRFRKGSVGSDQVGISDILKSKAFCYVTIIVVSNVVLTTPFAVVELIRFLDIVDVNVLVIPILKLIFTLNFVINSCFYVLWVRDFRHGLLNTLGCASLLRRRRFRKSESGSSRVSARNPRGIKADSRNETDSGINSTIKEEMPFYETSV